MNYSLVSATQGYRLHEEWVCRKMSRSHLPSYLPHNRRNKRLPLDTACTNIEVQFKIWIPFARIRRYALRGTATKVFATGGGEGKSTSAP
jgi:hypothetical protein